MFLISKQSAAVNIVKDELEVSDKVEVKERQRERQEIDKGVK